MASLEFDREADALYLKLRKGKVHHSEPVADNIVLDLDKANKLVGLEVLLPPTIKKGIKAQLVSSHSR